MKNYCEVVVTSVLPAIRSLITRDLIENHKLTQEEAANLLGLTQPAISQYKKEARGVKVRLLEKNQELIKLLDELTIDILNKNVNEKAIGMKICNICNKLKNDGSISKLKKDSRLNYECPLHL
ncbi:MAG: transcriptional regulator [Fervidobacterium sp.]